MTDDSGDDVADQLLDLSGVIKTNKKQKIFTQSQTVRHTYVEKFRMTKKAEDAMRIEVW